MRLKSVHFEHFRVYLDIIRKNTYSIGSPMVRSMKCAPRVFLFIVLYSARRDVEPTLVLLCLLNVMILMRILLSKGD